MKRDKLVRYGEFLLIWMLCAVCISATVCIYIGTVINIWSVLGAVAAALVILFADYARKRKLGGLLYSALFVCVGLVPCFTITRGSDMADFIRWFFSGSEAVETRTSFILTLTVMVGFLFTSAAYYFTRLIYRSSVITLITLIPFALSVKTVTSLPDGYMIAASAINIIIFIYYARKSIEEGSAAKGRSTLVVYTDYTVAVILLAVLLPKPSSTPYYEKFEELTSRFQLGGTSESSYTGEYKDASGITDDLRRGESVLLYLVNTSSPVYMKTQVFDNFNAESCTWTGEDEMVGSKKWQKTAPLLSYEKLGAAVEKAVEANPDVLSLYPQAEKLIGITETESFSTVYAQDYPAVYVLAPLRATNLILANVRAEFSARTEDGEIFTDNRLMPQNANYTVRYYTEDTYNRLIGSGLCDISFEDYGTALTGITLALKGYDEERKTVSEFWDAYLYAEEYAGKTVTEISPEMQVLADEITDGLVYDYQKAEAIEQYFHKNGFVYDLVYEPPEENDTPDYFVFESKTGICSDFATAYTLLARAAGLKVRYVEGFVMQPSETTPNMYFIYTDNAHAYPEVFIPGAGWMVYEPTPASITASGDRSDSEDRKTDPLAVLFTAIIAVAVIGFFVLMVLIAPTILEAVFRIKVKFACSSKAVILLYNRHTANMAHKLEISLEAFTPEQLNVYTEEKTEITLEPLTKPFIQTCYGGKEITQEEKTAAFECYKRQYKAIRKLKKRKE